MAGSSLAELMAGSSLAELMVGSGSAELVPYKHYLFGPESL